ncbi:uncharacterized protein LOC131032355 isoform X1 [Cryptomeria japonica]|uniref:uncharacterized protein LOC131032355 isoform X1 n=1 Tax=Cryptomeria japonica TaxID=3369 RepID=UPI0027DA98DB|nr:uncharacterized protein LOC131032355 isoform X1 [Cryptomeria japonica]
MLCDEIVGSPHAQAFVAKKNSHGNTVLHLAAFYDHHEFVKKFLEIMAQTDVEAGNFLTVKNGEGNTALYEAAKRGNYEVVKLLLEQDNMRELLTIRNLKGELAIFIAAQGGHTSIVRYLLPINWNESQSALLNSRVHGQIYEDRRVLHVKYESRVYRQTLDDPEMLYSLNMSRQGGQTPLHRAVFYRHSVDVGCTLPSKGTTSVSSRRGSHILEVSISNAS